MRAARLNFDPATSGASHKIMGPSGKRISIKFYAPSAGGVTLSTESPVVYGQGIVLTPGMQPVAVEIDDEGELVQRDWFAVYSGTFAPVSWIETQG